MGNAIGKAIRLDIHTAQRTRGRFARMCVELDLTKPLVPEFDVEGQVLSVVYESMGLLCKKCGWFGHVINQCDDINNKKEEMQNCGTGGNNRENEQEGADLVREELWKTVQKGRKLKRGVTSEQEKQRGSRFVVLEVEEPQVQQGLMQETVNREVLRDVSNSQGSLGDKKELKKKQSKEKEVKGETMRRGRVMFNQVDRKEKVLKLKTKIQENREADNSGREINMRNEDEEVNFVAETCMEEFEEGGQTYLIRISWIRESVGE